MFHAKKKISLLSESVIFKHELLVLADVPSLWDPKYFGFGKHCIESILGRGETVGWDKNSKSHSLQRDILHMHAPQELLAFKCTYQ